jgi:hypothetical protein
MVNNPSATKPDLMTRHKTRAHAEFGDFQTPDMLARTATRLLHTMGIRPRYVVEPTCGRGAFLAAAAVAFPEAEALIGIDINTDHLKAARDRLRALTDVSRVRLLSGDFFKLQWATIFRQAPEPWLILGNPPWVTSAEMSAVNGKNLPEKTNFEARSGIDAITGKSNFDISEWMLLRYLDWLKGHTGAVAVLCKVSVARRILTHIWKSRFPIKAARIFKIDALGQFGASVDACFFVLETGKAAACLSCDVFDNLTWGSTASYKFELSHGHLISDIASFNRWLPLVGSDDRYVWRSGIKHDCSKVMELSAIGEYYQNGTGEIVGIESKLLFPMLKSSDIGNGRDRCRRLMLVTQERVGEDTSKIKESAPKTWQYLLAHQKILSARGSSIYRNRPPFSIFGVGPYTFSPWKVAISGFYKRLAFMRVGPVNEKPVVFDDTIYFLPCSSETEAILIQDLLDSPPAQEFYQSMICWADKRPITVALLKRLSLRKLAIQLGREREYNRFA